MDAAIGVLINALKQIGIEHNTLIVYTSDHGSMLSSHGLMCVVVVTFTIVRSFVRSFVRSLVRSFDYSFVRSFA